MKFLCALLVLAAIALAYGLEADKQPTFHKMALHKYSPSIHTQRKMLLQGGAMMSKYARYVAAAHASGNTENLPMGGNVFPIGIFYISVGIGSPVQKFNAAVDSGSCTLLIPGKSCQGCTSNIVYDAAKSSTAQKVPCPSFDYQCDQCQNSQCSYLNQYQTCNLTNVDSVCSVSGLIYTDVVQLGSMKTKPIPFGTILTQSANFEQFFVIDGVIGFACESQYGHPTPLEALVQAGQVEDKFALCFDSSRTGGIMTIGGADPSLYTGKFEYTPFTGDGTGLYTVTMTDVAIGDKSIGIHASTFGDVVIDSGTNVLLLTQTAFRAFERTMQGLCGKYNMVGVCNLKNATDSIFNNKCFKMSTSQINAFPSLGLSFPTPDGNSFTLTMQPRNYILENTPGSGLYCLGVVNTGDGGFTIIGDTTVRNRRFSLMINPELSSDLTPLQMEPYVTLFDRVNGNLGFAPVNSQKCKYHPNL